MSIFIKLALFLLIAVFTSNSLAARRSAVIDSEGKYVVEWEVNITAKEITFDLTVETIGFIGFGLSPKGGMGGADIIIGGVFPNGTAYFSDCHATENGYPPIDDQEDYKLLRAFENATHTFLSFSRKLATCDPDDVAITEDTVRFIWSIGKDDNISYHEGNRGAYAVTLLSEPYPDVDLSRYSKFEATTNVTLPSNETTYFCTVHKAPVFNGLQHAVAFGPVLKGPLSEKHTHHNSLYSCTAPEGQDPETFFNRFIEQGGVNCLKLQSGQISAYPYCEKLIYTWTIGGRTMHMPEGIGFPVGEQRHEYYLMETHFDNPDRLEGLKFESGVQIFYTNELRPTEAGVIRIGQMYDYNFVVPPQSKDYLVVGHCSSNCTKEQIPETGIDVFNVMLHAHAFGKKMRFRHFRNGTELPWIANDDNYDNKYQDNRNIPLKKLLPGDQLAIECQYDNTNLSPPGTVIGGFGTREEMCEVVFYYYPRIKLENCRSNIPFKTVLGRFGIESVRKVSPTTNPEITAPEHLKGIRFLDYIDSLDWKDSDRDSLEELLRFTNHEEVCGGNGFQKSVHADSPTYITYPTINQEYLPAPDGCSP